MKAKLGLFMLALQYTTGLGFRVWGLGFGGLGLGVWGEGFRGFRPTGLGFNARQRALEVSEIRGLQYGPQHTEILIIGTPQNPIDPNILHSLL